VLRWRALGGSHTFAAVDAREAIRAARSDIRQDALLFGLLMVSPPNPNHSQTKATPPLFFCVNKQYKAPRGTKTHMQRERPPSPIGQPGIAAHEKKANRPHDKEPSAQKRKRPSDIFRLSDAELPCRIAADHGVRKKRGSYEKRQCTWIGWHDGPILRRRFCHPSLAQTENSPFCCLSRRRLYYGQPSAARASKMGSIQQRLTTAPFASCEFAPLTFGATASNIFFCDRRRSLFLCFLCALMCARMRVAVSLFFFMFLVTAGLLLLVSLRACLALVGVDRRPPPKQ
jgi:hypothetical protein